MLPATYDSTIRLLGITNNELTFNDDFNQANISRIQDFVLPSTGTFTIEVGSYNNQFSGNYTLTLSGLVTGTTPTLAPTAITPTQVAQNTTRSLTLGQNSIGFNCI